MNENKPRYQIIIDYYTAQISSAELKPGDKLPTGPEIAEQFGVSAITVTHAMRQLEASGLIKRIKKAGTFVTEQPEQAGTRANTAAAAASADHASPPSPLAVPVISLVMPFSETVGYEIFRGVEEECAKQGMYVTFHNSKYDDSVERSIIQKLTKDRVSGIIVYPVSSYKNIDVFSSLTIEGIPFALIDRNIEGLDAPLVISNNIEAGYNLASHLLKLGHTRIAFVCQSWKEAVSVSDRYKGYCNALIEAGIPPKPEWLINIDEIRSVTEYKELLSESAQSNEPMLSRLLAIDPAPTAAVVVNDYTATRLLKAALQAGVAVPEQLSITGFDNLSFTEHLEVPLTTIEQDFYSIGREAAKLVLAPEGGLDSNRNKLVLSTKLITRQSTSEPPSIS
ncbi:GntR family transcriptional regulator of arabinose operon/LacI family transcriptional regulator [Paenibacillus taihuensis]|uniref:GntR family transcriptional regulator of arabinose operon/LacI family transcriptional regulator n=1 Tax=Paenibacillus taihuensis TaxID=1156355 RepID=A0A3D9R1V8_9BACL|nr:GntR family transcriptional regulator [Paenibacillus taihuensis]REE67688.1 GntR family transcriptional regulator of arabinose operon/LacI family transcriptional regulator [Paenibacillus taihuensis]